MQYIQSSIPIGVVAIATCGADKARLALARSTVHGFAYRAGLAGMARIDLHDPVCLVEEHRLNLMPTDIQDGTVEAALLSDISPRFSDGASGACGHVFGAQTLDNHGPVAAGDVRSSFMRPVLADAGLFRADSGDTTLGFGMPPGTSLAPAGDALGLASEAVQGSNGVRQDVRSAVREHQRDVYAAVNPHFAANEGQVLVDFAANGNLPAKRGPTHSCFGQNTACVAWHSHAYPTNLGKLDTPPSMVQALNLYVSPSKSECIVLPFSFGLREPCQPGPRASISSVESFEDILLCALINSPNKIYLGAQNSQFSGLSNVVKVVASYGLIATPMITPLLKRKVPHQAAHSSSLKQGGRLVSGRSQRKSEASKKHC